MIKRRYVIRNTNSNTSWYLPPDFKLPRGMYYNLKWVEKNLPRLLVDSIHHDMDSAAPTHMSDIPTDNGAVFQIMMHSRYTKNAIQLHYNESIPESLPSVPVSVPDVKPLDDTVSVPVSAPESDERHSAESILGKMLGWFGRDSLEGIDEGITSEGITSEGITLDEGITSEGITSEGITSEGITLDEGITSEGITSEGITSEGITSEGITSEGITRRGSKHYDGIQSLKAKGITQKQTSEQMGVSIITVKRNWKTR